VAVADAALASATTLDARWPDVGPDGVVPQRDRVAPLPPSRMAQVEGRGADRDGMRVSVLGRVVLLRGVAVAFVAAVADLGLWDVSKLHQSVGNVQRQGKVWSLHQDAD
jgi:hypothetical protein